MSDNIMSGRIEDSNTQDSIGLYQCFMGVPVELAVKMDKRVIYVPKEEADERD
ncbi:hypothetical protein [Meiothermus sp.]|uniref:hypothetical protein n=1 Tax=Meiothermus sp. TaxID=1955249 RepID=UPI00307FAA97